MNALAVVDFRDSDGRLLGHVRRCGDEWEITTVDGRRTIVDARVEALLAGAAMADTVELPEGDGLQ